MPRTDGVSFRVTDVFSFRRPRPRMTTSWLSLKPIGLFTSVTVTVLPLMSVRSFAIYKFPGLGARLLDLFQFLAAQPRDHHRILERAEPRERRAHDVVRVRRSKRLGQDVGDAGRFHDRA